MGRRKIVQIATNSESEEYHSELFALCNDGTLWTRNPGCDNDKWAIVPPIPQGELES